MFASRSEAGRDERRTIEVDGLIGRGQGVRVAPDHQRRSGVAESIDRDPIGSVRVASAHFAGSAAGGREKEREPKHPFEHVCTSPTVYAGQDPRLHFFPGLSYIHSVNVTRIRQLDLNLLLVFDALTTEGSVTRGAQRIGLSQPAMSNAL